MTRSLNVVIFVFLLLNKDVNIHSGPEVDEFHSTVQYSAGDPDSLKALSV